MPNPDHLKKMGLATPSDFRFALKVHRSLTHEIDAAWQDRAHEFHEAVAALATTGRLGLCSCAASFIGFLIQLRIENTLPIF